MHSLLRFIIVGTTMILVSCDSTEPSPIAQRTQAFTQKTDLEGIFPGVVAGEWEEKGIDDAEPHVVAKVAPDAAGEALVNEGRHGVVLGAYSDGMRTGKYKWLVEPRLRRTARAPRDKEGDEASFPTPAGRDKLTDGLLREMAMSQDAIPVIIRLADELKEGLTPRASPARLASFETGEDRLEHKRNVENAIQRRKAEARDKQAKLHAIFAQLGIASDPEDGLWLVNALVVELSPSDIERLVREPSVAEIAFDAPTSADWTGDDLSSADHFNAGLYLDAGNDGEVPSPITGNSDLTVALLDIGFNPTHPVFRDGISTSRVKETWNCQNNPCTTGLPTATSQHGTYTAAAAAADGTDGQISGTASYQEARSGVAREAAILMIEVGNLSALARGLQRAVESGADVVSESRGGASVCDGNAGVWDEAVYAAESAGVLVTGSAGNLGESSGCNLSEASTVPSVLTVGQLDDPGSGDYASVDIHQDATNGPVSAVVDGYTHSTAFTAVDVVTTGRTQYAAGSGTVYNDMWGSSFAAPKVAGAGILFRDWAIDMGWASYSHSPGWLRANLIAMTDRAYSATSYKTSRFDKRWGGGRFQMRRYTVEDHPTGLWRWETATYRISDSQRVEHLIAGSGVEPNGLQIVKAYALAREVNGDNVADIDLYLKTNNCDGSTLRSDVSRDYKSMVMYGSGAAGERLCVELHGYHVPPGEFRDVQLVVYYSEETELR